MLAPGRWRRYVNSNSTRTVKRGIPRTKASLTNSFSSFGGSANPSVTLRVGFCRNIVSPGNHERWKGSDEELFKTETGDWVADCVGMAHRHWGIGHQSLLM